ncbi:3-deoxy-D-manno-octulosonic acid transferase [Rheinheimera riviphila]|uniref:3-deoxy-D-manno-octulosonic acid kinase n=1 Tax=Rheinheimera riviphila TaxID=1834037 RepID=A0A437R5J5_9GAMM|nr:lipid IV(A) 3-deoxy-D-manno-octulosonic acid transferase [Rheinheimera riviphila]RVU41981.1 3-deoxy-D-manno-octulosonic acid transferase [Rheinheimera riviphila]
MVSVLKSTFALSRLSLLLYTLLIYLLRLPMLLFFLWRSKADPAYRQRFAERFAWQQVPATAVGGIVVHAVSMGEVVAATPLIEKLLLQYPDLPITVTCTTPTGSARIQAAFGARVHHCYLPFDTPGANRRFLRKFVPQLILLLETELWPNLVRQAHAQHVPVVLVNARLSAKSARGYRRFGALVQPMLRQLSQILTQDDASRRRFLALIGASSQTLIPGTSRAKIQHTGNLKFEMTQSVDLTQRAAALNSQWGARPVWVAGSTHAGEDEILLQAFAQVLIQQPDTLLILVPRHPDRFAVVSKLVADAGLSQAQRSLEQPVTAQTQVLLGDTMGELMLWYQLADVVFIGGSLIERGGHNPLEPMSLAKPIQSGPHVFNFAKVFQWLSQRQAVVFADSAETLAQSTIDLLQAPAQRQLLAERGFALYQQHGGATTRILQQLLQLLPSEGDIRRVKRDDANEIWYDPVLVEAGGFSKPSQSFFDPHSWLQFDAVIGQSTGRNTVWFVQAKQQRWVLRHYYRGGLIGKLNKDRFLKVPVPQSRAMAEFQLLQQMHQLGLPVPRPVAALFSTQKISYRADILLELVDGSLDLSKLLRQQALTPAQWQQIGVMIRRFHDAQIYHSDLNCHNILLDPLGKFWLIDFDKCAQQEGDIWKEQTLARLQRSLNKEAGLAADNGQSWFVTTAEWQLLKQGYSE